MMINTVNKPERINQPDKIRTTVNLDAEVMKMVPYVTTNLSDFVRKEVRRKYQLALRRAEQRKAEATATK